MTEQIRMRAILEADWPVDHELFRACIQCAVGIEQGHSPEALARYAKRLREMADKHCHGRRFRRATEAA